MKSLVFYSWQSDLPNSTNRGFIETALEKAAKTIRDDDSIQVEPVVDRDTVGVPGTPEIAATIFAKIESAEVFVCDVSLINEGLQTRPTPNPNVLLELGFAIKALGWNRILMVLNTAFGTPERLPFDLRMRRVITYEMNESCTDRSSERKVLESKVQSALRTIFEHKDKATKGDLIQPARILDQVLDAIETNKSNHAGLVRRYMIALVADLEQCAPKYSGAEEADDLLVESLAQTIRKVAEFCRMSEAIATMNSEEGATALYESFELLISHYNAPKTFVSYDDKEGDFYKFLGHELFTAFISYLMRKNRWRLIGDLLKQELYIENPKERQPKMVSFEYLNKHIELLDHRKRRLSSRKLSLQGELLQSRFNDAELSALLGFAQFMQADFFLYLRSFFRRTNVWEAWFPASTIYMKEQPRFLVEATAAKNAEQLLYPLGIATVQDFKAKFTEAIQSLNAQFGQGRPFPANLGRFWNYTAEDFGKR